MPPIAITDCRKIEDYKQAISHAGGEGRVVHASEGVEAALEGVCGLLLTGGDDVAPSRYNEAAHPTVKEVAPERDEFEIALVLEARKRNLPILAICRGIQVLNVACGGALIQDITSQVPGAIDHRFTVPPHQPFELAHEIWVERDSLLFSLLK